jgi:glycosyltransferase involved in cell wall biosynthesis
MKIAYVSANADDGTGIMRVGWPVDWINKFTDHSAFFVSGRNVDKKDSFTLFRKCDVAVFHKATPTVVRLAQKIHDNYPSVKIVFDCDDYDPLVFDTYYPIYYMSGAADAFEEMVAFSDGVTTASDALTLKIDEQTTAPVVTINNAFDLSASGMSGMQREYFMGSQKATWGGGINHYREFDMLLRWDVLGELADKYPIDFYIYGVNQTATSHDVKRAKGGLHSRKGEPIHSYVDVAYSDASFLFAPLINHPFNTYRSPLKCIEAGVARKAIICSDVQPYRDFLGEQFLYLVPETKEAWKEAFETYIENPELCRQTGERLREVVEEHYEAQVVTRKRIEFYEEILG